MAFETFLTHEQKRPRKGRRITYAVSLAVHGLAVIVGVAGSLTHVDELQAATPTVTFWHETPPPPPPAGQRPPKVKHHVAKTSKPTLVAPPDKIAHEEKPEPDSGNDADEGNDQGPPGVPGGTGPASEETLKFLPPSVAKGQLAIDPQASEHRPRLPPAMMRAGVALWALLKVCIDRDGTVQDVKVMRSNDASVEASFIAAIRTWRYTPYRVNGRPVPFCTSVRYELQSTN